VGVDALPFLRQGLHPCGYSQATAGREPSRINFRNLPVAFKLQGSQLALSPLKVNPVSGPLIGVPRLSLNLSPVSVARLARPDLDFLRVSPAGRLREDHPVIGLAPINLLPTGHA
jgi:hypothetical protein